jgi:hypothetical protein
MTEKLIQMLFYLSLAEKRVEILSVYVDLEEMTSGDAILIRKHANKNITKGSDFFGVRVKIGNQDPLFLCLDRAKCGFSKTIRSAHVDEDMGKFIQTITEGVER